MIRDAVHALGGKTTNTAVRDWILERYPDTHRGTIGCQTIICTVNHPSRVHYQQNKRPRPATAQYDFLVRTGRGCLELYSPRKHGAWEIVEKSNGALAIRQTSSPSAAAATLAKSRSSNGKSGAGFGHWETNRVVERAAVAKVTRELIGQGYRVETREPERIGYDLDAFRAREELHVEVKGISGGKVQFVITEGEVKRAKADPAFVLFVVTDATSERARLHRFTGAEITRMFSFTAIAYMAVRASA